MGAAKITDVATAAGVSPATVSYVLSGNRPISKRTREKVLKIVKELKYTPNPNAQALKLQKSKTIGLLASDFKEVSVSQIILSVEQVACQNGYHIFFTSGLEFNYEMKDALTFLMRRKLDGLIVLFGVTSNMPEGGIESIDIPLVSINRPISDKYACILPDNRDGGFRAAKHLMEAGCSRLALIAGPGTRFSSEERVEGFKRAVGERGIELKEEFIYYGDFNYESGKLGLESLIRKNRDIDGLFCTNDMMAAGAINAASEMGILIPNKLKVIGYDNRNFSSIWPIPISTFTAPFEEMGKASADILFSMIEKETRDFNTIYVKSTLISRRSTGH
jgi:LacI family transcriptional regulator